MPGLGTAQSPLSQTGKKPGALLYVTDNSTKAYLLSYPALKVVGTISGFHQAIGACSDAKGNVWIADYGAQQIDEFAHGGTKAIVKLTLPNFEGPQQCAIDKKGDLAVSAWRGGSGPGYVLIYKGGKGTPQVITDTKFWYAMFIAYDEKGDLFVDGTTGNNQTFVYAELKSGAKNFTPIKLKQQIGFPGGLQFDGRDIALGDQQSSVIYRTIGAKVAGQLTLADGPHSLYGFVIDGKTIICLDNGGTQAVETYNYPAGGAPLQTVDTPNPSGVALSR